MKHIRRTNAERRVQLGDQLLPGIPNEITLDFVVPKLPWTTFHMLILVSRGWEQAIRSRQVYDARVRTQSTQTIVVMNGRSSTEGRIVLYSTSDGSIYRLPPIPGIKRGILWSCQCRSLDGKLYVLGGSHRPQDSAEITLQVSAKVYVLDLVGARSWKQCASMAEPRQRFGCGVANGKIYVFGGACTGYGIPGQNTVYCGSEVYDPATNAWSPIAPMKSFDMYHHVITVGDELFVHYSRWSGTGEGLSRMKGGPLEVYNPLKNQWRTVDPQIHHKDILLPVGGNLHKLRVRNDHLDNDVFDIGANSWIPKSCQSCSFSDLGSYDSHLVEVPDAVVVDDELLAVVCSKTLYEGEGYRYYTKMEPCLVRSQGFGSQDKEIEWQVAQCSISLNLRHCYAAECGFFCTIQI